MSSESRVPLIAGNWKMNGSLAESQALVSSLVEGVGAQTTAEMLICPPFIYLDRAAGWREGSPLKLGGQNLCANPGSGAFTGEVSGEMLAEVGCEYVIVGHSERRTLYAESDVVVAEKFRVAQDAALIPILCVGETLEERETGNTEAVVSRQVTAVVDALGISSFARAVVAYEPIWAIGTGQTATPAQAQDVHAVIRGLIEARDATIAAGLRILYGGSMKAANASELLSQNDIDGGLVGGASLVAADFLAIYLAAAKA